ncbi:MAG: sugar ABC transporter permease [Microbacteriaceae bacterium]|jgi:arabinogalactan oligomer/maltooligosaccharide transport system permease protein
MSTKMSFFTWVTQRAWRHLVAIVMCVFAVFPLLYVVSASFASSGTLTASNQIFASFSFDNYVDLVSDPARPYLTWWFNTLIVSAAAATIALLFGSLAAYAFSRLRFRGRRIGLGALVLTQMFPQFLGVVAIFLLVRTLGEAVPVLGLNTHTGLIAVYLGGALGVNTYLMYGYFNTVPREIDEAAKIDGASHIRTFFTIIIPLVAPILVVVWMITYIAVAGDYVIASALLSDPNMQTATVGLFTMINTFRSDNWGAFSAGAILSALPVVLMFLYGQKYIVGGLSAGSVK